MSEVADEELVTETPSERRRRQRWRGIVQPVLAAGGVTALALGGLWIMRAPIAESLVARELAARQVRASYRLVSIGLRTQRIEDIVMGDPARPDLSARWVEVDIGLTGFTPRVVAVRASGVRLRGRLADGTLSLGELDKFLGQGGSTETLLPDLALSLIDARASLSTDYGAVGAVMDGQGNLRNGFDGRAVLAMPEARFSGCGAKRTVAALRIRMKGGAPHVTGPVTADALSCPDSAMALAAPRIDIDATSDEKLASVVGEARLRAKAARGSGMTAGEIEALLSGKADAKAFAGEGRIKAGVLSGPAVMAGGSALKLRFKGQGQRILADGTATVRNVAARGRDPLAGLAASTAGTPVAPLVARLTDEVRAAGKDNDGAVRFVVRTNGAKGGVGLSDLRFTAASGARLAMDGGTAAAISWPDRRWNLSGAIAMGGGGLPEGRLTLDRGRGGGASGRLDLKPYAAANARLAISPVRFTAEPGGATRFATYATLDGPLADGGVKGLAVPLSGAVGSDGALTLNPACAPLKWDALRVSTLSLEPATLGLCPVEGRALLHIGRDGVRGGAQAKSVALAGRIGSSPLRLAAAEVAFGLSKQGFRASGVETRIGGADAPVILGAGTLDGLFSATGLSGRFGNGHGRIGSVPLDLSDMAGRWRFAKARLDVDGGLRVTDTERASPRLNPLLAPDAHLSLVGGRIAATGHLRHPARGGDFAAVDITHDLSSGKGEAKIALQDLRFGQQLQPDDLTPLALGVVANVNGPVTGSGTIRWTGSSVTSGGRFATEGMNLAAAFGPVEGLSTTLNFTDLLAIETAPGQVATLKSVNPGVEVRDGRVVFQLQQGFKAQVQDGEWPFAGGTLRLLPSTLDFDAKGARRLIFRVTGLDAGAFINTMELKNISATGTFDGLLPMVFDATGGRIEGGILVARQEGMPPLMVESAQNLTVPCDPVRQSGTLSYVGDVSNAEMGTYGKLAFDALKKLRYKCLTILLDGAIDGEFVTRVAINGVNQGSEESRKSAIMRNFLGIPFLFNVRIEAPFRGLMNTYQSFVDPSALVRSSLGPQYRTVLENRLAVQPPDSEKGVSKEGE